MVQFASYLRCVLCKMRLIFPRILIVFKYLWCHFIDFLNRSWIDVWDLLSQECRDEVWLNFAIFFTATFSSVNLFHFSFSYIVPVLFFLGCVNRFRCSS